MTTQSGDTVAVIKTETMTDTITLLRIKQVLQIVPISRSAWYRGIRDGIYPRPVKVGRKLAFWRSSDISALVASLGAA